jgi:pimeloyl-ACP methyl ester carboxylesterase
MHRKPFTRRYFCALAVLLAVSRVYASPLDHGDLISIPTRRDATQSIFIESPSDNPKWVIVLFGGTPGDLHLDATGATTLKGNFVIRSASHWIEYGDAVVLVDTPSDHTQGVDDLFRLSGESLSDIQAVMGKVRARFPSSKIALVGTSAGTVSVANALERDPDIADAFVLTSPVTVSHKGSPSLSGVLDVDGNKHRVMIVSNKNDQCVSSPAYAGKRLAEHFNYAFVEVESTDGEGDSSQKCAAHAPHGFLGIEKEVLGDIQGWLNAQAVTAN